jgi:chemotaxis protein MotD
MNATPPANLARLLTSLSSGAAGASSNASASAVDFTQFLESKARRPADAPPDQPTSSPALAANSLQARMIAPVIMTSGAPDARQGEARLVEESLASRAGDEANFTSPVTLKPTSAALAPMRAPSQFASSADIGDHDTKDSIAEKRDTDPPAPTADPTTMSNIVQIPLASMTIGYSPNSGLIQPTVAPLDKSPPRGAPPDKSLAPKSEAPPARGSAPQDDAADVHLRRELPPAFRPTQAREASAGNSAAALSMGASPRAAIPLAPPASIMRSRRLDDSYPRSAPLATTPSQAPDPLRSIDGAASATKFGAIASQKEVTASAPDLTPSAAAVSAIVAKGPDAVVANNPQLARAEQTAPSAKVDAPASDNQIPAAPPIRIDLGALETYLPAVILREASNMPQSAIDAQAGTTSTSAAPLAPPAQGPLKVLKFQIEPASLGAISVKMRVTQSRIELQIEAQSARTSALIENTQDKLAAAISDKGYVLDSFKVHVEPGLSSPDAPRDGQFSGGQAANSGERGFANEDRSGQRHREAFQPREAPRRDEAASPSRPLGIIL